MTVLKQLESFMKEEKLYSDLISIYNFGAEAIIQLNVHKSSAFALSLRSLLLLSQDATVLKTNKV
jgi:flagellin-specific chaperone FliS